MTLSLGFILALLLLAPGLAAYAALFVAAKDPQFRPAPPPPGSILTLSILLAATLVVHAVGATIAAINEGLCRHFNCIPAPFEPNAYLIALDLSLKSHASHAADIASFLLYNLALSVLAYFLVRWLMHSRWASYRIHGLLYGWLADLVEQSMLPNTLITAFVLSKFCNGDIFVGYEGITENITLDDNKNITSITITDCTAFLLKIGDGTIERKVVDREAPIPRLYISGAEIENIAFNVFDVSAGEEDPIELGAAAAEAKEVRAA